MNKFLLICCIVPFTASLSAVPMSPELENRLKREGRHDAVIQELIEARTKGVDEPNPRPFRAHAGDRATLNAIAICVDFSDHVAYTSIEHYDSLLSSLGTYATGSMRDFFLENSYNNIDVVTTVVGWLRMPETYDYYVDGQYGFGSYPQNAQRMAEDAVWAADSLVDFSQFDNGGDGYVDALFIVHAGPGAEQTGNPNDIWSHAWRTVNVPYVDSVYAYRYSTEPEDGRVGVFAHEAGHAVFGLPDLYDYDYDSRGVGRWTLMAGGSWNGGGNRPAHLDAWCKIDAGFVSPQIPATDQTGVIFPRVEDYPLIYKLWTDGVPGLQFFVVENRQRVGFDNGLPGHGMLIYHVDEMQDHNNNQWYPGYTNHGHYLVALEQADGLWELEKNINSGDFGDPYPGETDNRAYNDSTIPDSKDYWFNTTFVAVENISDSGDTMTADIKVMTLGIDEVITFGARTPTFKIFPSVGHSAFTLSLTSKGEYSNISIFIFDVSGRLVKSFSGLNSEMQLVWHGDNERGDPVSPGIYFVQLNVQGTEGKVSRTKKLIVLK